MFFDTLQRSNCYIALKKNIVLERDPQKQFMVGNYSLKANDVIPIKY